MSTPAKQDYRALDVPPLEAYVPERELTVIVPARDRGDGVGAGKLDLVLAALQAQTYPVHLLRVIVVDDGSPVALSLPELRPDTCELLRLEDDGSSWGKSRAFNAALDRVTSPLVMSLDADMLLHPDHLRALARWCDAFPGSVALGYKQLVDAWETDPATVQQRLASGEWDALAPGARAPHAWFEDLVDSTAALTGADLGVFRALVGASVLLPTDLMRRAGAYDPAMRLAEDTELGYRLVQCGALLVPEPQALAWHLGMTSMADARDVILPHNQALLAPRVPLLDYLRRESPARAWAVASAHVNIEVTEPTADLARQLVTELLAGRAGMDVTVTLVGDWPSEDRYAATADPRPRMRALVNWVAGEARVEVAPIPRTDVFPVPRLVFAPASIPVTGLRTILARLADDNHGVVAAAGEAVAPGSIAGWGMAAVERARLSETVDLLDPVAAAQAVARHWSAWWLDADTLGLRSPDTSPAVPAAAPSRSYATAAWQSWRSAGYSPQAGKTIVAGLARGVQRRARRVAKRNVSRVAARL